MGRWRGRTGVSGPGTGASARGHGDIGGLSVALRGGTDAGGGESSVTSGECFATGRGIIAMGRKCGAWGRGGEGGSAGRIASGAGIGVRVPPGGRMGGEAGRMRGGSGGIVRPHAAESGGLDASSGVPNAASQGQGALSEGLEAPREGLTAAGGMQNTCAPATGPRSGGGANRSALPRACREEIVRTR
jgi:hypothetical protein